MKRDSQRKMIFSLSLNYLPDSQFPWGWKRLLDVSAEDTDGTEGSLHLRCLQTQPERSLTMMAPVFLWKWLAHQIPSPNMCLRNLLPFPAISCFHVKLIKVTTFLFFRRKLRGVLTYPIISACNSISSFVLLCLSTHIQFSQWHLCPSHPPTLSD